ncbi:MAG: hypothetical protein HYY20_03810 [Candidatus Tectomicrobia bacterium]|uniref:PSP1 C-terminal domain-containing protein n=1 Tax=Tectimicrobiota bacterium TaxID=2528274 RepID=A0A932FY01_UNCTE|nr:hypothetical protein [Candidatus Tectomicrobia bacterium]
MRAVRVVKIKLRDSGKILDFQADGFPLKPGDCCVVQGEDGKEIFGEVIIGPQRIESPRRPLPFRSVLRKATEKDQEIVRRNERLEQEAFEVCKQKIEEKGLPMKLVGVSYTFEGNKAILYFTANRRVDFRELIRDLAHRFRIRIEMRQIGVRDEARMFGGFGICGRNLCCNTFICEFKPVTVSMAKEQNLTLDPAKISGICGRLMCCLAFELDSPERFNKKCKTAKKAPPGGPESPERPGKKEDEAK